ncbi:hypothetical protein [Catellatospora citrea]|uniref:Uncharacterized protein n=1 Tax=Catellatospora citrea TaxID=53366 RepID=A0A8J3KH24_9ACTN|nr:hypothetical protein [Catellatospora citrea]RKE10567.1 hypothetical protein C8E86_5479 [Catellatospora citrea]GIF98768.1 hypothetical protein Cci01nite_38620 [Catellatospora citrea]
MTGSDAVLTAGGCSLRVTYTGPEDDLVRILAEVARDLAEHGPASPFWDELTPAQRQLLTARFA